MRLENPDPRFLCDRHQRSDIKNPKLHQAGIAIRERTKNSAGRSSTGIHTEIRLAHKA